MNYYSDGLPVGQYQDDVIPVQLAATGRTTLMKRTWPQGLAPGASVPTVLFIHGLGGSRDDYPWLAEEWAAHGYLVLRPDMADSPYQLGRIAASKWWERSLETVEMANEAALYVPAGLLLGPLGIAGHSDGARSCVIANGLRVRDPAHPSNPPWRRIETSAARSVLLASPPALDNTMAPDAFSEMVLPMFALTGTADNPQGGLSDPGTERTACARESTVEAGWMVYRDGDHGHGWPFGAIGRTDATQQRVELDMMLAWLDYTLKDQRAAAKYIEQGAWQRGPGVTQIVEYGYR
jgi:hypothetical protein